MASIPRLSVRLGCCMVRRFYGRAAVRQPVKVLSQEEIRRKRYIVSKDDYQPWKELEEQKTESEEDQSNLQKESTTTPTSPKFEKMGEQDLVLSRYVMNTSCKKKREQSKMIMLEGKRLITEALQANLKLRALFFSHHKDVQSLPLPTQGFIFQKIVYNRIQRYSNLTTSPGIIGQ